MDKPKKEEVMRHTITNDMGFAASVSRHTNYIHKRVCVTGSCRTLIYAGDYEDNTYRCSGLVDVFGSVKRMQFHFKDFYISPDKVEGFCLSDIYNKEDLYRWINKHGQMIFGSKYKESINLKELLHVKCCDHITDVMEKIQSLGDE